MINNGSHPSHDGEHDVHGAHREILRRPHAMERVTGQQQQQR
jgi:hypothetical protein